MHVLAAGPKEKLIIIKYAEQSDSTLETLAPWDSVFFTRIAKCGYETDLINAFFPLVPASLWFGSVVLGRKGLVMVRYPPAN